MSDVIFNTVIRTDGHNNLPKPSTFESNQLDSFLDGDERWVDTNICKLSNRVFFDMETICTDEAWIICSGPIPCSESELLEIVSREKTSIWKSRCLLYAIGFWN